MTYTLFPMLYETELFFKILHYSEFDTGLFPSRVFSGLWRRSLDTPLFYFFSGEISRGTERGARSSKYARPHQTGTLVSRSFTTSKEYRLFEDESERKRVVHENKVEDQK